MFNFIVLRNSLIIFSPPYIEKKINYLHFRKGLKTVLINLRVRNSKMTIIFQNFTAFRDFLHFWTVFKTWIKHIKNWIFCNTLIEIKLDARCRSSANITINAFSILLTKWHHVGHCLYSSWLNNLSILKPDRVRKPKLEDYTTTASSPVRLWRS